MAIKGTIYVLPRGSGKTKSLSDMFTASNINTVYLTKYPLITQNTKITSRVYYSDFATKCIISIGSDINTIKKFTSINRQNDILFLIDEYFMFSEEEKTIVNNLIYDFTNVTCIVKSTSNKLYNKSAIDIFRAIRKFGFNPEFQFREDSYLGSFKEEMNSLLSDPNFEIVEYNKESPLTKEQYDIQVNAKIFK